MVNAPSYSPSSDDDADDYQYFESRTPPENPLPDYTLGSYQPPTTSSVRDNQQWYIRREIAHGILGRSSPAQLRNLGVRPLDASRPASPEVRHVQHRVYSLRCAHCDTFISNRGMRAVLLLRPHITLFSTDSAPSSCGALYSLSDVQPPSEFEHVERTCECLTQSLACFGCGNIIGYQIVAACDRCTASVSRQQRSANGHRYVFHHNEVTFVERRYQTGEHGIASEYLPTLRSAASSRSSSTLPSYQAQHAGHELADIKELGGPETSATTTVALHPLLYSRIPVPPLQEGDTLYWHQLAPAGELRHSSAPNGGLTRTDTCVGR